jgi:deoxyribonuclease IV
MLLPKIGAHVSVAGGLSNCIKNAKKIGAESIQIFAGSPRRYEVPSIEKKEFIKYQKEVEKEKIFPIYIHASYLLNLASEDKQILKKSIKCLEESLLYAGKIGAEGVIYHPGSPKGRSKENAIEREIEVLKRILGKIKNSVFLIIENTSGVKKIGTDPSEIGYIFKKVNSEKLRVCIDTAHSLESGNIREFTKNRLKKWISWWEEEVSFKNVILLHINDSLTSSGSNHDRHANIGEGFIGLSGFKNLISFKECKEIPWILEVPGFDNNGPDKKNIDLLKKIRK